MTPPLIIPDCIYRLPDLTLFTEQEIDLSGEKVTFDLTRCAVLLMVPRDGVMGVIAVKASESAYTFFGGRLTVPCADVAVQNTTNLDLLANARKALSAIETVASFTGGRS